MKVYIGIDWSEEKHDVVFLSEAGAKMAYLCIPHSLEGFRQFHAERAKMGLKLEECVIGIETSHSLLVDYLLEQGYPSLYVLPPSQVHANQGRFRQSGAKDDASDARLIGEILRTDQRGLHPWRPDKVMTRQMRTQVRFILELQHQITRLSNQLRAVLLRYYPVALEVFKTGLGSQVALEFIIAYPTLPQAQALSLQEFSDFAKQHRYPHPKDLPACYHRLQASPLPASRDVEDIYYLQAQQLAQLLHATLRLRLDNLAQLHQRYLQHPCHDIFASLPACGDLIGPALLAFFGDDRQRFPNAATAQAMAGTCPVTKRSGKFRSVRFRFACDQDWRYICHEWAHLLIQQENPIALAYYHNVRSHAHSQAHAERCLANRWIAIVWKLWVSGKAYDPAIHLQQRATRSKPR